MSDSRIRNARWLTAAWLTVGVGLSLGTVPLFNVLWFLILWVWGLYAVLGLILLLSFLRLPRRTAFGYATITLAGTAFLWFGHLHLATLGERPYLAWRKAHYWPRYRAIVAEVLQGEVTIDPYARWMERRGVDFMVDTGPPVRVAFLQPDGLLDNWEGIVYDPTGRVATATGWREGSPGEFTAAADVLKLFGGDLVRCEPIEPKYYRCWFT